MVQSAASLKMSAARGAAESYAPHLCNAYPELYPVGGPPLDAGLIHNTAAYHLMYCLRDHLRAIGCPYAIAEVDALLHSRPLQGHDGSLEYTRPSILVYREPKADLDPAGAFHVDDDGPPELVIEILSRSTRTKDVGVGGKVADKREHYRRIGVREYWVYNPERLESDQGLGLFHGFRLQGAAYAPIKVQAEQGWPSAVLGTRWVLGDEQRTSKNETFALMRLCQPGTMTWYPTIAEKNAALAEKDEALAEKNEALAEKNEALAEKDKALAEKNETLAEKDKALAEKNETLAEKDEALTEQAALLAQYVQRFGSLEAGRATRAGAEPPSQ